MVMMVIGGPAAALALPPAPPVGDVPDVLLLLPQPASKRPVAAMHVAAVRRSTFIKTCPPTTGTIGW
jgi:hypothetical protein